MQDAKEKGFGKKNENKQNKKMRGGKMSGQMHRGMMRMRGMRGMPGMRGPRPTMRAMMMRGRGGPFMYVLHFSFKTSCVIYIYIYI